LLIARRRMRSLKSHCFLHTADVPHSPGLATFSFVGLQFPDSRIASVRIVTGTRSSRSTSPGGTSSSWTISSTQSPGSPS